LAPFIGGERRFGKGIFSPGEVAGELGELRELRPVTRRLVLVSARRGSAGDGTRRAGVGAAAAAGEGGDGSDRGHLWRPGDRPVSGGRGAGGPRWRARVAPLPAGGVRERGGELARGALAGGGQAPVS
jgi:hypothetical protein